MSTLAANHNFTNMLADLRQDLFKWLPGPTAFAAFYIFLLTSYLFGLQPLFIVMVSAWVIVIALLAHWLKTERPQLAAHIYIAGLILTTSTLIWGLSVTLLSITLLLITILLSMTLLGLRPTLVMAGFVSLVIIVTVRQHQQPGTALLTPLGALWITVVIAWLSNRTLIVALEWAWNSHEQARRSTEKAQHHRGELVRTLKALDQAYNRLERFSVQLAQARNAAEEARRVKQQFVANVSHELRTPLNIIIGFSEAIALSPESYGVKAVPRPLMGDINRIYRSAGHLKRLIDDVLDLSQIDAYQMPLLAEQTSLANVVTDAATMIEGIVTRKGLALKVDVPPSLPPVFLDRLRIRQVLLNLLSNAVRFTDSGGITVSVRLYDEEAQVSVADTGPGIAPEDLGRVFEEFQQIDASLSKRYDGTGLGLAVSRRFIELHGGRLWAESKVGQGSRFSFTLPLTAKAGALNRANAPYLPIAPHVEARAGRTILVTAQDPMPLNLLKRHLHNYHVRHVVEKDLPQAIEAYLPHAIVTNVIDPSAPPNNGKHPTLSQIATTRGVPLVACPLPDPAHLSRALGIDHYLVKPIARERLLAVLADYGDTIQRILIVDDDVQLVELMARIVRAAPQNYEVDIACGSTEGLARMQDSCPDLVLLDLMMPDLNGLALLELMRADPRLRQVRVIMITARDLPKTDFQMPGQNSFIVYQPTGFSSTETLNCLQAILDTLPVPTLSSATGSQPGLKPAKTQPPPPAF